MTCPYNSAHRFIADKFMFHVMRCKDGKKLKLKFSRCPYHSMHIIRNEELNAHIEVCPYKDKSDKILMMFKGSAGMERDEIEDDTSRERSRSRNRNRVKKE